MGRKPKPKPGVPDFNTYSEACPKMRRRWKRDVVPEIAAWLAVVRERVNLSLLHASHAEKYYPGHEPGRATRTLAARLQFCNELLSILYDQWSEYDWNTAVMKVKELLNGAEKNLGLMPVGADAFARPLTEGESSGP